MTRSLSTLIRLGRWRLEEARRGHAELERHLDALEAERAQLLGRLAEERANTGGGFTERLDFHPYFRWAMARGDDLAASIGEAEARVQASRDSVAAAFGELKTLELAAERARARAEVERARREQMELDEISIDRHRRENADQK